VTSATRRGGLGRRGRRILGQVPAGEEIGAKQNRLLFGFLEAEVLPPAMGAAELDIDPTPWSDVAAAVFGCTPTRWNTPTMARTDP
jgi:hypothetical protein